MFSNPSPKANMEIAFRSPRYKLVFHQFCQ